FHPSCGTRPATNSASIDQVGCGNAGSKPVKLLGLTRRHKRRSIVYQIGTKSGCPEAMIILSKLADYGVIVATHLAAYPERQVTAATVAVETRLPQATVAKILKALAHAGVLTAARAGTGRY